jgi:putative secretion ATPase (PEP-CTERM system associated)
MYENYYGLKSKPFQLNPDPNFYFGSKQHSRAKAYLDYGVQRSEGFIVITGEVGAGKTTLVRGLLDSLDAEKTIAAHLVTTQVDAEDILRLVGAAFGVPVVGASKADVLMALEAFLVNQARQNKRCLLVVDEAQNLSLRAVEELRMLSNFQFETQALLQTFLIGQPEFRSILQNPNMHQLRQRVTASCHIGPLDAGETRDYIEHRLKRAGSNGQPGFSAQAFNALFMESNGIPRRINFVCDRLLLYGFLSEKTQFELDDVNEIVREMHEETSNISSRSARDSSSLENLASEDISRLTIDSEMAAALRHQIDSLGFEQSDARMRRLEGSVLRLERINLEILTMLKKMFSVPGNQSQETST